MNKKSKIKSTLDSLFTGGRIKPDEGRPETPMNIEKPKPASIDKVDNSSSSPKVLEVKKEAAKPVEKTKPIEAVKPVEAAKPKEPVKPVEVARPVEQVAVKLQNNDATNPKSPETPVQPAKPVTGGENPPSQPVKPVDTKPVSPSLELDASRKVDLDDDEHLVIFSLGKELYGVTIHSVESIIKIQAITEVPKTASYVLGVTNLRGTVVPVLDLRKRFNLQFADTTANTRIIIINAEGSKVGIVVDEVTEVLKVAQDAIQPPPPMSTTIESAFINGIAKINDRLVILLDLEKVLASSSRQYNR